MTSPASKVAQIIKTSAIKNDLIAKNAEVSFLNALEKVTINTQEARCILFR